MCMCWFDGVRMLWFVVERIYVSSLCVGLSVPGRTLRVLPCSVSGGAQSLREKFASVFQSCAPSPALRLSRSLSLSPLAGQKERKFFYFVGVVILRELGYLDKHNKATEIAKVSTKEACPATTKAPSVSLHVTFKASAPASTPVQLGRRIPEVGDYAGVQEENQELSKATCSKNRGP